MGSHLDLGFAKYADLIEDSRFRERIRGLQQNPNWAFAHLHEDIRPCCFGTAVYVIGENSLMKDLWKRSGKSLDDYSDACGDFVCIPDDNSPGYIGQEPMELFLKACEPAESDKDTILSFYWNEPFSELRGQRLRHSGIFLGKKDGRTVMFHQLGEGKRFGVCSIEGFLSQFSANVRTLKYYFHKSP